MSVLKSLTLITVLICTSSHVSGETVFPIPQVIYQKDVETGFFKTSRKSEDGTKYLFSVNVPDDYAPDKAYPLHVLLHGGVDRDKPNKRKQTPKYIKKLAQEDVITLFPAAWRKAKWWQQKQR